MTESKPLKARIAAFAVETLGFDACGFTAARLPEDRLRGMDRWLAAGLQGEMEYLREHQVFKASPEKLLPGVRSAIVLAVNYNNTTRRRQNQRYKIARYAAGRDYHRVIGGRLKKLLVFLKTLSPGVACYSSIDTRPVAERALAVEAGLGFRGKNTLVLRPGLGSYFFIAVVLTTLPLEPDQALSQSCGECRLCLDACPTQALSVEQGLDATRCISYLTIERKAPLTPEEGKKTKGWLFGCDICQEVCPYNHGKTPLTQWPEFLPEAGIGFDFFDSETPGGEKISRRSALYRSRKRLLPNWRTLRESHGK